MNHKKYMNRRTLRNVCARRRRLNEMRLDKSREACTNSVEQRKFASQYTDKVAKYANSAGNEIYMDLPSGQLVDTSLRRNVGARGHNVTVGENSGYNKMIAEYSSFKTDYLAQNKDKNYEFVMFEVTDKYNTNKVTVNWQIFAADNIKQGYKKLCERYHINGKKVNLMENVYISDMMSNKKFVNNVNKIIKGVNGSNTMRYVSKEAINYKLSESVKSWDFNTDTFDYIGLQDFGTPEAISNMGLSVSDEPNQIWVYEVEFVNSSVTDTFWCFAKNSSDATDLLHTTLEEYNIADTDINLFLTGEYSLEEIKTSQLTATHINDDIKKNTVLTDVKLIDTDRLYLL